MTLSSATSNPEQVVYATCTVTNTASTAINVTAVVPSMVPHSVTTGAVATSSALGAPPLQPGATTSVPGSSGTLAMTWPIIAHAPTSGEGLAEPSSFIYDVGALVYTSDGSVTSATTTTLTVSSPTH